MSNAPLPPDVSSVSGPEPSLADRAAGILDLLAQEVGDRRLIDALTVHANLLAPQELAEVYGMISQMVGEQARMRVARLAPQWVHFLNQRGRAFSREMLFDGVVLYRSAVQAAERGAMVCFTDKHAGLFMANSRFLDLIGQHAVDVVILTSGTGMFFDWVLPGCGSFHSSMQRLKAVLAERGIRPGTYVGASSGGGPAVVAAVLDGQASAVMFGGRFYWPGRKIPLAQAGSAFLPICDCWRGPKVPIYSIYNEGMAMDDENTSRLAGLLPHTKVYAIANEYKHSPIATLAARQKLRPVLNQVVRAAAGQKVSFDLVNQP